MEEKQKKYQRRSIRLKGYDYTQRGAYFITICTKEHKCYFGEIVDGEMVLNNVGIIVRNKWIQTESIRQNIMLDEFVIMPNHIHGIIIIIDDKDKNNELAEYRSKKIKENFEQYKQFKSPSNTIGAIIRGFKSSTTKEINQLLKGKVINIWQRNYFEHIIRNENELNNIREYIVNNPLQWELDSENPKNI